MVRELLKKRSQGGVSIQKDGSISLSKSIMNKLGYSDGDRIVIAITETSPLCIGLRLATTNEVDRGYTLGYLSKNIQNKTGGGKISCSELSNTLKASINLPRSSIPYGLPPSWKYDVLIMPSDIPWQQTSFSTKDLKTAPEEIGVYQLLSEDRQVLYIGEGILRQRFKKHLQNDEMLDDVSHFQFCQFKVSGEDYKSQPDLINETIYKDDALFLQKQLLGIHFENFATLPKYNSRWF